MCRVAIVEYTGVVVKSKFEHQSRLSMFSAHVSRGEVIGTLVVNEEV